MASNDLVDDFVPHCRCETCVDHRMRIMREVGRLRDAQEQGQIDWRSALRRFVNDQQKFHNESVLGGK